MFAPSPLISSSGGPVPSTEMRRRIPRISVYRSSCSCEPSLATERAATTTSLDRANDLDLVLHRHPGVGHHSIMFAAAAGQVAHRPISDPVDQSIAECLVGVHRSLLREW